MGTVTRGYRDPHAHAAQWVRLSDDTWVNVSDEACKILVLGKIVQPNLGDPPMTMIGFSGITIMTSGTTDEVARTIGIEIGETVDEDVVGVEAEPERLDLYSIEIGTRVDIRSGDDGYGEAMWKTGVVEGCHWLDRGPGNEEMRIDVRIDDVQGGSPGHAKFVKGWYVCSWSSDIRIPPPPPPPPFEDIDF